MRHTEINFHSFLGLILHFYDVKLGIYGDLSQNMRIFQGEIVNTPAIQGQICLQFLKIDFRGRER